MADVDAAKLSEVDMSGKVCAFNPSRYGDRVMFAGKEVQGINETRYGLIKLDTSLL